MDAFVNREREKAELSRLLDSNRFELIVLYGRRRIGKTRLVLELIKNRPHVYYLAIEKDNLKKFILVAAQHVPEVTKLKEDWEVVLDFLKDKIEILIIDEFQNAIKEDRGILSLFQRTVDTRLKNTRLKLLILGSSVSMISSEVLNYKSPLYGRKTASKKIAPMTFFDIHGFFPKITAAERAEIYGLADGIPYYLEKIQLPLWKWLENELMQPTFLKEELDFILKYEFEDLGTYKTILEAIANGKTTVGEIRDYARLQRTDISPYLAKLVNTEFVRRELPITERAISKKGRYYIKDQFVAFWFRYIQPNASNIEERIYHAKDIRNTYSPYMGFVFEKICRQFIVRQIRRGKMNFNRVGRWWERDNEIDMVALNESTRHVLFAECKWKENVDAQRVLGELQKKTDDVRWNNKNRQESFALFARSFRKKTSFGENVLLFDLKDFEKG